jgi:hypothetical protein
MPASAGMTTEGETPTELETGATPGHSGAMTQSPEEPVMLPFPDKTGTGWHVVIRYHHGHERRIEGFASEQEALDWIVANAKELDQ